MLPPPETWSSTLHMYATSCCRSIENLLRGLNCRARRSAPIKLSWICDSCLTCQRYPLHCVLPLSR
ncbi:hypothetical protein LY78DRAFT_18224 [Colletotrichum sublineola]|nr:hypothetical protein LY78DRAFT_18224 [Colletotrichum sublineola]